MDNCTIKELSSQFRVKQYAGRVARPIMPPQFALCRSKAN